jgi:hypothetical protein
MTERGEWMKRYAAFQGRVQQLVAQDIHEHGRPHAEREHSFKNLKERAIEMGGLAFELYIEACALEEEKGRLMIREGSSLDAISTSATDTPMTYTSDVEWADRDPNEEN